jgi:hypothetical protein
LVFCRTDIKTPIRHDCKSEACSRPELDALEAAPMALPERQELHTTDLGEAAYTAREFSL